MGTGKRTDRVRTRKGKTGAGEVISVRMYDVGFGDCFLVRIPTRDGMKKILFDCGTIKKGSVPMAQVVRRVIDDAKDRDGVARIDVVVATHRHEDHVGGFVDAAWADVEVREVWMPWTEEPDGKKAKEIRNIQNRLASRLEERFKALAAASPDEGAKERFLSMREFALNSLSNESAMRTLYSGFAGKNEKRYLSRENTPAAGFETPVLPGVAIHILGPSTDPGTIGMLDPPAGQHYLRLVESLDGGAGETPSPFGPDWRVEPGSYESAFGELSAALVERDRTAVRDANRGFDERVLAVADQAINGTSLMIVLRIGGAALLFPGDAQWGTWRDVLGNDDCRKLLRGLAFYKVGHHGSHNATPVEFVERVVGDDFWAMVSTRRHGSFSQVPKPELLDALRRRTGKVVRSDRTDDLKNDKAYRKEDFVVEAMIPC